MTIYLYKKTHNQTGFKYLGKTTADDPHKYQGSGKRWKPHLKKHGYDVTTEILRECQTKEEVKHWGKYYSDLWNVVDSEEWANFKPEEGDGGKTVDQPWNKGKKASPETIEKMKEAVQNRSDATKQKMVESGRRSYEKTFALLTPDQRTEKYNNSLGKLTTEQRQEIGRKSKNKGGDKWSKASAGTTTVTDMYGNSKRVPTELYNSMKYAMIDEQVPIEQWQYVQVSSKESIRRRNQRSK